MCFSWLGPQTTDSSLAFGPLAVIWPTLQRMDVANIINRHLPKDPQAEFGVGDVLNVLIAARLADPVALCNVGEWALKSGADLLSGIPPEKLNDDRLGRALDKFYTQRHSIAASIALHVSQAFDLSLERLHYDPTHILLHGDYESSKPRTQNSSEDPSAHITFGHSVRDNKIVHAGVCAAVDDYGAVPILGHVTDGNRNGRKAIAEQFELLQQHLQPQRLLLISDRGTFSAGHVARLKRQDFHVLCSVPFKDFRSLYDQKRSQLSWNRASYLSIEQKRRRNTNSPLPKEHYELAVVKHQLTDPDSQQPIACRVIFVFSTADQKVCRRTREKAIAKIRTGLEQLAVSVARGHHTIDRAAIERRVAKLFGKRGAARYFQWDLVQLSEEERAALPPPARGCRRATHRLVFSFDQDAADADAVYDGISALLTTAPQTYSGDQLFTQFKEQNLLELAHHQWKTPLAVHPIFLKSPKRVEALVHLLLIALSAYHVLQRIYRQHTPDDAPVSDKRTTTETILKAFSNYTLRVQSSRIGRVIHPTRPNAKQRDILNRLSFPTPTQILADTLERHPP